ncbi:Hydrolase_4 domain-containing protein [Tenacibaculum sp. 190130A14a]|uniref:Hydrolase_4 domain-containing protein n=1 Tax=Tenacibaculum polynesiense TaxID=3137857 RepID=A0ABM9P768_9FLAO
MKTIVYLTTILLLLGLNTYSQASHKSFNEELVITINKDSISGYALIANGNELKETVILLHGLPGHEKNLDLAEKIRQNGKNVIYFNYRGSWGSQGEFLYSNCLEDISKVIDYLSSDIISKKLRVKKNSFILIGHSLGGGIAVLQGIKDQRVIKIIALSSFNAGEELKNNNSPDELVGFQDYLNKQFMLNIDSKKFLSQIINHKQQWNLTSINTLEITKPFIFIDENNRNEYWIKKIKKGEYLVLDSDHSFSDKRNELSLEIIKWLDKN